MNTSLLRPRRRARAGRTGGRALFFLTLLIVADGLGAAIPTPRVGPRSERARPQVRRAVDLSDEIDGLERRLDAVEAEGRDLLAYHAHRVAPLADVLGRRTGADPSAVERAALALAREGHAVGVDPRLLTAVLLVENPWLDPLARSHVGAVGLMQVMPFHAGQWGCPGDDLEHPETNICHGAKILAEAIRRTQGDLDTALLRYNGCRNGTNTPDCHRYPHWVYARAGSEWMAEIEADRSEPAAMEGAPTS